ncbi:MAG: hypothetical protein ABJA71_11680 [Ginsengibacter sp.]
MKRFWFRKGLMFLVLFFAAVLLFSLAVMGLWNAILPAVLGVKTITFVQAFGILILSKILFGGFARRGVWNRGGDHQWKRSMQDKWANMTPEEKEKFKAEWKSRCGNRWKMEEQNPENTPAK